jgi:hypothetical protein
MAETRDRLDDIHARIERLRLDVDPCSPYAMLAFDLLALMDTMEAHLRAVEPGTDQP